MYETPNWKQNQTKHIDPKKMKKLNIEKLRLKPWTTNIDINYMTISQCMYKEDESCLAHNKWNEICQIKGVNWINSLHWDGKVLLSFKKKWKLVSKQISN